MYSIVCTPQLKHQVLYLLYDLEHLVGCGPNLASHYFNMQSPSLPPQSAVFVRTLWLLDNQISSHVCILK